MKHLRNLYGTNMAEVIAKVSESWIYDLAVRQAVKRGRAKLSWHEAETWKDWFGNTIDGHSSCDVSLEVRFSVLDPRWRAHAVDALRETFDSHLSSFKRLIKDREYRAIVREFLFMLRMMRYDVDLHPHTWLFVVRSFSSEKHEVALERLEAKHGPSLTKRKTLTQDVDAEIALVTEDDVIKSLSESHWRINQWIWVAKADPGVIVANERFLPFDKKDGWSGETLPRIMQVWFWWIYDARVKLERRKNG